MKFKEFEWKQETKTREHANIAFGLEADVWAHNNGYVWAIGDSYSTYRKGSCKTITKAKMKAENAFVEYVTTNLQKCTE